MACQQCGSTDCTSSGNTADANCQCVPSSAGSSYCDPRFATLPAARQIKLIGASGECLATFPRGACGLIFWNENGYAQISNAPAQDLPTLLNYLQDLNQPDGLARQDGKLIEGIPPEFSHLMVLTEPCSVGNCCTKPEWKKWRGPANTQGYVFWDGSAFSFGGINEQGVVTSAILTELEEGYLPAWPEATDPGNVGTKTLGYLKPEYDDLYKGDSDTGIFSPLNPTNDVGFVVYRQASACDGKITPQVASLCDVANPPCVDPPVPVQLVGCAEDGDVASTGPTDDLLINHCNKVLVSAGGGAPWQNASIGRTWFPGFEGTVRQDLGGSGSFSVTITEAQMAAAATYAVPTNATHVIVHVIAKLRKSISERSQLIVTCGGVQVCTCTAYSWDGANEDLEVQTATAIVPLSGTKSFALDVNHSNVTSSNYDLTVNLAGFLACAELEA